MFRLTTPVASTIQRFRIMDVFVILNKSSEEGEFIGVTSNEELAKRWRRNGAGVIRHTLDEIPDIPDGYYFFDVELYRAEEQKPLVYQSLENLAYRGEHVRFAEYTIVYAVLARDPEEAVTRAREQVAGQGGGH